MQKRKLKLEHKTQESVTYYAHAVDLAFAITICRRPPRYVPYKGTFVLYNGTYGAPDQGQTLDV
jgi:hypothetical protein